MIVPSGLNPIVEIIADDIGSCDDFTPTSLDNDDACCAAVVACPDDVGSCEVVNG